MKGGPGTWISFSGFPSPWLGEPCHSCPFVCLGVLSCNPRSKLSSNYAGSSGWQGPRSALGISEPIHNTVFSSPKFTAQTLVELDKLKYSSEPKGCCQYSLRSSKQCAQMQDHSLPGYLLRLLSPKFPIPICSTQVMPRPTHLAAIFPSSVPCALVVHVSCLHPLTPLMHHNKDGN